MNTIENIPQKNTSYSPTEEKQKNLSQDAEALFTEKMKKTPPILENKEKKTNKEKSSEYVEDKSSQPTEKKPSTPGDAILGMLSSKSQGQNPVNNSIQGAQSTSAPQQDIISQLTDRILVSMPNNAQKAEIRITLKNDVLPNTEIRMQRDGNSLNIQFVTNDIRSEQILTQGIANLENSLTSKIDAQIKIQITSPEQADLRKEGSHQEQNEGRSRNQRNIYDEMKEE